MLPTIIGILTALAYDCYHVNLTVMTLPSMSQRFNNITFHIINFNLITQKTQNIDI